MKTNKSYTKRLKFTKNGKIKCRKPNQNHFRAKRSRSRQMRLNIPGDFVMKNKDVARFVPFRNFVKSKWVEMTTGKKVTKAKK